MTNNRFVLDTNVIVSALLLPRSVPRQAFDKAFDQGIVLASIATLDELDIVIRCPKFDRYVSEEKRLQFFESFIRDSIIVQITETATECRDPKDNKFLEIDLSGKATLIVSGDPDLLVLHPYRQIPILSPQAFVDKTQLG